MPSDKFVQSNSVQLVDGNSSTSGSSIIRRVTVTETKSSRLSLNNSVNTSVDEEWERKPKTDYTYAKTASYLKYSPTKGYPNPNMARRRLHGGLLYDASHLQSSEQDDSTFFSSTRVSTGHLQAGDDFGALSPISSETTGITGPTAGNLNNANNEAVTARQQHRAVRGADGQLSQDGYVYPGSTTRSGTFYGVKERLMRSQNKRNSQFTESTVTRALEFDDADAGQSSYNHGQHRSTKYYEKQMEYAGESMPYKEAQTPLHNLYGLDRADIVRDVADEADSRSDRSAVSVLTTTTAVIKSAVSSSISGTYRLVKRFILWLYMVICNILVLAVSSVWTRGRSPLQISPSSSVSSSSSNRETSVETTLQLRRRKGAVTHTTSHTETQQVELEAETARAKDRQREGILSVLARIMLFVPSLIYAYALYPCYLLVRAAVDSVRFGSTGLVASLKYCATSIRDAPKQFLTWITSLWSSKSQSTDLYHSVTSPGSLRKSPHLGKSVTFDVQEEVTLTTYNAQSARFTSRARHFLYKTLVFIPSTLYVCVLSPLWSGCHTIFTSVWTSVVSACQSITSGCARLINGVGAFFTSTYNTVSSLTLWRQEALPPAPSKQVTSKSMKQRANRRQSARLRMQLDFSDNEEDITDSEGVTASGSQRDPGTHWTDSPMQWLWAVVMFLPNRIYGAASASGRVCSWMYRSSQSAMHWLFVEKIGGFFIRLGSRLTKRSSSAVSSTSSVTMETSSSDIAAARSSTNVSRRSGHHITSTSVAKETMSMATENRSSSGSTATVAWCSKCLELFLVVPKLVLGLLSGIWHLVKYVSGTFQAFAYWLFVESIGSSVASGGLWMTERLRTVSSYIIITDVWLVSRTRRCGLCCLLPLLLLIPFLLCGSYYVYDQGRDAVIGGFPVGSILAGSTVTQAPEPVTPASAGWFPWWLLLGGWFRSSADDTKGAPAAESTHTVIERGGGWEARDHTASEGKAGASSGSTGMAGGLYLTEEQLQAKIRDAFVLLYGERASEDQARSERAGEQIVLQQTQVLNQYRVEVQEMSRQVVREELAAFTAGALSQQREADQARQAEVLREQERGAEKLGLIQDQYAAMAARAAELEAELLAARRKMDVQDEESRASTQEMVLGLEGRLAALQADMAGLQATQAGLMAELRTCCQNDSTLALLVRNGVREQLAGFLTGAMGGGGGTDGTTFLGGGAADSGSSEQSSGSAFTLWLQNQFAKRDDLDTKIAALAAKLNEQIKSESEAAARAAVVAAGSGRSESEKIERTASNVVVMANGTAGLSEQQVKLLIREALYVFGADKTGMVDYALESAGGSVISTRCSETYHRRTAQLSLFGIPLWYTSNSPRTVVQPEVHPGQCWAFRGSHGYLVVQLAGVVKPTGFSLEHIPKSLSPTGKIDSAPREFSVRGLVDEGDKEGVHLGEFVYEEEGEPLQYFAVQAADTGVFPIVELMISSNWGNEEYTCLYRFRVHGQLHRWSPDS